MNEAQVQMILQALSASQEQANEAEVRQQDEPAEEYVVTASNSADLDVQIIGASYAQSDARYQYDFSAVKTSFDQQAVTAAVQTACAEYNKIGTAFITEARSKIRNDELPGDFEMESAANMKVSPVRNKLDAELQALSPAGDGALIMALLNGEAVL